MRFSTPGVHDDRHCWIHGYADDHGVGGPTWSVHLEL